MNHVLFDATFVKSALDAAFLVALAAWSGSLLYVLLAHLPDLARRLPPETALRERAALWGRLDLWGATWGAIALPASLGAPLTFPEYRSPQVGLVALLLIATTLTMLHGVNQLAPALQRAIPHDRDSAQRLDRRARRLHGAVAAALLLLLVSHAFRPPPRTIGIIEPTPLERAQRVGKARQGPPPATETPNRDQHPQSNKTGQSR